MGMSSAERNEFIALIMEARRGRFTLRQAVESYLTKPGLVG
jgi:hypothetical protein